MRFSFTMIVVVAATLTSAAIIPRNNASRMDSGDEDHSHREVEGRHGRAHPREFLFPDNEIPQRRSDDAHLRRHPRDFPRRGHEAATNESRTPARRHPRDFPRREAREVEVEVTARNAPAARFHPRQFRSLD